MRIGIIGAGNLGATAARLFVRAGHDVALSNARGPASLRGLAGALGPRAHARTVDAAARFGEVVLLSLPWRTPEGLPDPAAVAGRIVIDAMNPYRVDGGLFDLGASTSSEQVLERLPGVRLVKAFNTIYWRHLAERGRADVPVAERHAVFVAGDDAAAKRVVMDLVEAIGFAPVDTGTLRAGGRLQEPGGPFYDRLMRGAEARQAVAAQHPAPAAGS